VLIGVIGVIGVYQGSSAASAPRFPEADFRGATPDQISESRVMRQVDRLAQPPVGASSDHMLDDWKAGRPFDRHSPTILTFTRALRLEIAPLTASALTASACSACSASRAMKRCYHLIPSALARIGPVALGKSASGVEQDSS
jgi:hypothetical protein